jgi:hypothetical protein
MPCGLFLMCFRVKARSRNLISVNLFALRLTVPSEVPLFRPKKAQDLLR